MSEDKCNALYPEAKESIKRRDYEQARELLRQILIIDEDYKDAAQLLASLVERERRKWYTNWRLWVSVGIVIIVGLIVVWFINIPTITIGGGSNTFPGVSSSGFRLLTPSSGLPYAVSSTFAALGDPPATCTFYTEYYNSNVIKFGIVGDDGGDITSSYKTLTIS